MCVLYVNAYEKIWKVTYQHIKSGNLKGMEVGRKKGRLWLFTLCLWYMNMNFFNE